MDDASTFCGPLFGGSGPGAEGRRPKFPRRPHPEAPGGASAYKQEARLIEIDVSD
jgi:hypothetical protein